MEACSLCDKIDSKKLTKIITNHSVFIPNLRLHIS